MKKINKLINEKKDLNSKIKLINNELHKEYKKIYNDKNRNIIERLFYWSKDPTLKKLDWLCSEGPLLDELRDQGIEKYETCYVIDIILIYIEYKYELYLFDNFDTEDDLKNAIEKIDDTDDYLIQLVEDAINQGYKKFICDW